MGFEFGREGVGSRVGKQEHWYPSSGDHLAAMLAASPEERRQPMLGASIREDPVPG